MSRTRAKLAIIDLGGQYCHMISRRLRDIGVVSEIFDADVSPKKLRGFKGIILSGGPSSVSKTNFPTVDSKLFALHRPILGICYGHQLLAKHLGAVVEPANGEFGRTRLSLTKPDSLFNETPNQQTVWMSHSDSVISLPPGLTLLATTERCPNAAFADFTHNFFGVQFHPEVVHTEHGAKMLRNFSFRICKINDTASRKDQINGLISAIKAKAGNDSVFFLVSGGVDSTVAFALCAKALSRERILGMYVDTGLMRKNETEEFRSLLHALNLQDRLIIKDASEEFLNELETVTDPEAKRRIIGRLFVKVQKEAMQEYKINEKDWLLGQGTIYPDTIESGGNRGTAALIKTHHNRCEEIRELLEKGRVIEPLAEFYKDEVRQIGLDLGLGPKLVSRWPFPGPGLAIRCICSDLKSPERVEKVQLPARFSDYTAVRLQVRSVGVQGDGRTYRKVVALRGPIDYDRLQELSSELCNSDTSYNRVIIEVASRGGDILDGIIKPTTMTRERVEMLREADFVARSVMEKHDLVEAVWQFPVVLVPLSFHGGESVVLRPVNSEDGMTANFARLPTKVITEIGQETLRDSKNIDRVFLDITDKPPATIEWE